MVLAISGVKSQDYELYRIMQELISLGIQPSGNKAVDQAKLVQARNELINKIAEKKVEQALPQRQAVRTYESQKEYEPANDKKSEFENVLLNTEESYTTREKLEEEKLGAMTIAQLNRIYFGL